MQWDTPGGGWWDLRNRRNRAQSLESENPNRGIWGPRWDDHRKSFGILVEGYPGRAACGRRSGDLRIEEIGCSGSGSPAGMTGDECAKLFGILVDSTGGRGLQIGTSRPLGHWVI